MSHGHDNGKEILNVREGEGGSVSHIAMQVAREWHLYDRAAASCWSLRFLYKLFECRMPKAIFEFHCRLLTVFR